MKLDTMTKCISCRNINCRIYRNYTIQLSTHTHTDSLCATHTHSYVHELVSHTHAHTPTYGSYGTWLYFFSVCKKNIEFKEERTRDGSKCLSFSHTFRMRFAQTPGEKTEKIQNYQSSIAKIQQMNEIESITNQNQSTVLFTLRFL